MRAAVDRSGNRTQYAHQAGPPDAAGDLADTLQTITDQGGLVTEYVFMGNDFLVQDFADRQAAYTVTGHG